MERIHRYRWMVRFFIIATFTLLPFGIFVGFLAWNIGEVAETRAKVEADRLVRVVESQQEQVFRNIRNTLIGVLQFAELQNQAIGGESCDSALNSLMGHMNRQEKMYINILVAEPDGNVVCSAVGEGAGVNLADRRYFQDTLIKRDFTLGQFVTGRVTKEPTFTVAYPILKENGDVKLVAIGALNLKWINDFASRIKLLEDGPILVVTGKQGKIIAQYPEGLAWVGQDFYPMEAIRNKDGSFRGLWLNRQAYLFSFVRMPIEAENEEDYLKFFLGVPVTNISNFVETEVLRYALALLLLSLIFGLSGWLISKKLANKLLER